VIPVFNSLGVNHFGSTRRTCTSDFVPFGYMRIKLAIACIYYSSPSVHYSMQLALFQSLATVDSRKFPSPPCRAGWLLFLICRGSLSSRDPIAITTGNDSVSLAIHL